MALVSNIIQQITCLLSSRNRQSNARRFIRGLSSGARRQIKSQRQITAFLMFLPFKCAYYLVAATENAPGTHVWQSRDSALNLRQLQQTIRQTNSNQSAKNTTNHRHRSSFLFAVVFFMIVFRRRLEHLRAAT